MKRRRIMGNLVKEKLESGKKVVGTFFSMGNPSAMECLGFTGLDFAIIDTEHGPFDTESAMALVRAAEAGGITPFMRIADVSHREIQRAVDIGVQALIVPCLRTMDEMKKLVDLAKFAPIGNRGFIKGRGAGFGYQPWSNGSVAEYMAASNERLLVLPQCETAECLADIENVVALDGIDGIFVGPFDLSISLGIPGDFENPKFKAAVDRILSACKAANKYSLIYTTNVESAREYLAQGYDGVANSLDFTVFTEAYKDMVNNITK
jgi:4-hydroxy-2-oxoheptanedioate aldolase